MIKTVVSNLQLISFICIGNKIMRQKHRIKRKKNNGEKQIFEKGSTQKYSAQYNYHNPKNRSDERYVKNQVQTYKWTLISNFFIPAAS